jgi:hypothetical protein
MRKIKKIFYFIILWTLFLLCHIYLLYRQTYPYILSRHRFHEKCTMDLKYRNEFLEACLDNEKRPPPTSLFIDTMSTIFPKLSPFIFFNSNDIFTIPVITRLITLTMAKIVFGDALYIIFNTMKGIIMQSL